MWVWFSVKLHHHEISLSRNDLRLLLDFFVEPENPHPIWCPYGARYGCAAPCRCPSGIAALSIVFQENQLRARARCVRASETSAHPTIPRARARPRPIYGRRPQPPCQFRSTWTDRTRSHSATGRLQFPSLLYSGSDFPDSSARGSPTGKPSPCWQPVPVGNVQRRKVFHGHGVRRDSELASVINLAYFGNGRPFSGVQKLGPALFPPCYFQAQQFGCIGLTWGGGHYPATGELRCHACAACHASACRSCRR